MSGNNTGSGTGTGNKKIQLGLNVDPASFSSAASGGRLNQVSSSAAGGGGRPNSEFQGLGMKPSPNPSSAAGGGGPNSGFQRFGMNPNPSSAFGGGGPNSGFQGLGMNPNPSSAFGGGGGLFQRLGMNPSPSSAASGGGGGGPNSGFQGLNLNLDPASFTSSSASDGGGTNPFVQGTGSNQTSFLQGSSSSAAGGGEGVKSSKSFRQDSRIPGEWRGPIDIPTTFNTSEADIQLNKLSDCQLLILEITDYIRSILIDYENINDSLIEDNGEPFDIMLFRNVVVPGLYKEKFEKLLDKCGYTDVNKFLDAIFRSFLSNPDRSAFGEDTNVIGFKVERPNLTKWNQGRYDVYQKYLHELFPSQSQHTEEETDDTLNTSADSQYGIEPPDPKNESVPLQMIASVTDSAFELLSKAYTAACAKLSKLLTNNNDAKIRISAKIGEYLAMPEFSHVGRDMAKTREFINNNKSEFDGLTKSVGTVDIIHDIETIKKQILKSIDDFTNANIGIIGKGGQCNPKLLHKLVDDLFKRIIDLMNTGGITDVKAQEQITLVYEDVMINILACILERVEVSMSENELAKKELFWYESGIKWEGMTSFIKFFDGQNPTKQTDILDRACSISSKQINHEQLRTFIEVCRAGPVSFMFKQPSLCDFDAGPATGSSGISVGIINTVGVNSDDVCLICNKTDNGNFYWICCVYDKTENSTLRTLKVKQPKAIFFGNGSPSIDSLKIALDRGIVPSQGALFGDDGLHLRCNSANTVTNPFYNGSYSDFLQASSLSTEVELFIHDDVIAALSGVQQNLYVSSNSPNYGPCQMFLSNLVSDKRNDCVLVLKTSGDCIQECIQKEHYLRTMKSMGTDYNIEGEYVDGKNIAADFTVDSFVGKRKYERYITGTGNPDGTFPGIYQQQPGHGAKYSLPIGGNENPEDKVNAFVVKIVGLQSLLKAIDPEEEGNNNFNIFCEELFGAENIDKIELGRVFTAVDFVASVSPKWLAARDKTEIDNDIFSMFFYRMFQLQQEINNIQMFETIRQLMTWDGNIAKLLLMPTVDHVIRDDVSKDYENNSGNLIAEIFGQWDLTFGEIPLYMWVTGITSNGLECRFLFKNDDKEILESMSTEFHSILTTILTTDESGETAINKIPSSSIVSFAEQQLDGVINSFKTDNITTDFKIPYVRGVSARAFNWCLTAAYKIPAGLESLISVLSQQATLKMSVKTLDNLKVRIRELATNSVNTLTMRASRLDPIIKTELDKMLTGFLNRMRISGEGSDLFDEDINTCIIGDESDIDDAAATQASFDSVNEAKRGRASGSNSANGGGPNDTIGGSRKRNKKSRRRNTRRKIKHYNKKSKKRGKRKTKTRKR